MANISCITITRNSEGRISQVVRNALEIGTESIVVDTGSTDKTAAEATDAGARVVHFERAFDYSSARNVGTDAATGDWVLHLDDDEWFDPRLRERLYETVNTAGVDIFTCWACDYLDGEFTGKYQPISRLFRREKAMHKGLVHEDVYPIIEFGVPNLHIVHHIDMRTRDDSLNSLRKRLATQEADLLLSNRLAAAPETFAEWFSRARHLYDLLDETRKAQLRGAADENYRLAETQHLLSTTVRVSAAYFQSDGIKDHQKAIRILTKGLSETPDTFHYQLALGRIYFNDCKVRESLSALERAAEKRPTCLLVHKMLESSRILERNLQGDYASPDSGYARTWEVYPEFPQTA